MSRDAPIRIRRIRNRNTPPTQADRQQQRRRTPRSLRAGDAARQVVDGVAAGPAAPASATARRDDDAGEAERRTRGGSAGRSRAAAETGTHLEYSLAPRPSFDHFLTLLQALIECASCMPFISSCRSLCILAIAYRYYSAFIAAKVMVLDDARVTPAHTKYDGAQLLPDAAGGCSSATTSPPSPAPARWSARCWRRSSATRPGFIWLVAGVLPGRRGARLRSSLWASTRRGGRSLADIARTEIGPVAGITAAHRDPLHPRHRARRPRHRRRQRAGRQRLGHVHDRHDHPARAVHGLLHVRVAQGPDHGSDGHRRHRCMLLGGRLRQERRRVVDRRTASCCRAHQITARDGDLRLRRVGAAGVDAARRRAATSARS